MVIYAGVCFESEVRGPFDVPGDKSKEFVFVPFSKNDYEICIRSA